MLDLTFPSVHRDDVIEIDRIADVSICIINYEQAEERHRAYIKKLIKLNRGEE
jgi:hypothetical protein